MDLVVKKVTRPCLEMYVNYIVHGYTIQAADTCMRTKIDALNVLAKTCRMHWHFSNAD